MTAPPDEAPRRRPFTTADLVLTPLLSVLLVVLCGVALVVSMFAAMGTDSCSAQTCSAAQIGLAYAVAWGGIGASLVVAAVGVLVSIIKRRTMFGWPLTGLVVLVAATALGGVLFITALGH